MFLYLIPAIGVTVSAHYCGGKITSVSINPFDTKHKCTCGNKKMAKDCCKDETAMFKLDDEQQKTKQILCNVVKFTNFQPSISSNLIFDYKAPLLSSTFNYSTHPPNDLKHPLYIRHRVFRI